MQEQNWGIGFAIPAVAMALAVVLFVAGYKRYTHQQAKGSPLERLISMSSGAVVEFFKTLGAKFRGRQVDGYAPVQPPTQLDDGVQRRTCSMLTQC